MELQCTYVCTTPAISPTLVLVLMLVMLPMHGVRSASVPHPHARGVVCISATPTCKGCGLHQCHTHLHNITITLLNVVNTGHKNWKQYIITNHTQLICITQVAVLCEAGEGEGEGVRSDLV